MPQTKKFLNIKRLVEEAILPSRATERSVGYDIYSIEDRVIDPGSIEGISTGIAVEFPPNYYGQIFSRSGLASKENLVVVGGVIDPDYQGEIKVLLHNVGKNPASISRGQRIAQLVLLRFCTPGIAVKSVFQNKSQRGDNGLGSSGKF